MSSTFLLNLKLNQIQAEIDAIELSGPVQNPMLANLNAANHNITNVGTLLGTNAILTNATINSDLHAINVLADNITASNTVTCDTLVYKTLSPPIAAGDWITSGMSIINPSSLTITATNWVAYSYTSSQQPSMNGYTAYTSMSNIIANENNAGIGISSQPGVPFSGWNQSGFGFPCFNSMDLGFLIDAQGNPSGNGASVFLIVNGVTASTAVATITIVPNAPIVATIYYNDTYMELYIGSALVYTYTYTFGTLQAKALSYAMMVGGFNGTYSNLSFFPSAGIMNNPSNDDLNMSLHSITNATTITCTEHITIDQGGALVAQLEPIATAQGMKLQLANDSGAGFIYDSFFNPPPSSGGDQNLQSVLTTGNDAGGLAIVNASSITCTEHVTINQGGALSAQLQPLATAQGMKLQIANDSGAGFVYDSFFNPPPSSGTVPTLAEVLTSGTDGGAQAITNVTTITCTQSVDIDKGGSAVVSIIPVATQSGLKLSLTNIEGSGYVYDTFFNPPTVPTLAEVLTSGTDGGGLSITNIQSLECTEEVSVNKGVGLELKLMPVTSTTNGMKLQISNNANTGLVYDTFFNPPPTGSDQNLTQVLTTGNDAGGLTITNVSAITSGIYSYASDQNSTWVMVPYGFQKNSGQLTVTRDQLVNAGSIFDSYYNPVSETVPFSGAELTLNGGSKQITLTNASLATATSVLVQCTLSTTSAGYNVIEMNIPQIATTAFYSNVLNFGVSTPEPPCFWITGNPLDTFVWNSPNYNFAQFQLSSSSTSVPTMYNSMFLYNKNYDITGTLSTIYLMMSYPYNTFGGSELESISYQFNTLALTGEALATATKISTGTVTVPPNA